MQLRDGDPEHVGSYVLLRRLGAGGMGTVYLARAESGRQVAVKMVHGHLAQDAEFRVRFRREVTAARRVSGAFTAPVVDADPEADIPWMATAYVPGPTLRARVREGGPLVGAELRLLVVGLVEALVDLHTVGVIHRDLKPGNVLLTEDGPRVIDFGISRAADHQTVTVTNAALGTPPYMSPEQVQTPRHVTSASDVFSLGSVLVFAVTGRGPFDADNQFVAAHRVAYELPELEDLSGALRDIAECCLKKDPDERPGPQELLEAFRRVPETEWGPRAGGAEAGKSRSRSVRWARSSARRRFGVGGVLAVALAATVWGTTTLTDFSFGADHGTPSTPSSEPSHKPLIEPTADTRPEGWADWERPLPEGTNGCRAAKTVLLCTAEVGPNAGVLLAYSGTTGKRLWTQGAGQSRRRDSLRTSAGGTTAYYVDFPEVRLKEVSLTAVDVATGTVRWSTPDGTAMDAAVVGHGIAVTLGRDKKIRAWDAQTGDLRWHVPAAHSACRLVASDGRIFADCEDSLAELDTDSGAVVWSWNRNSGSQSVWFIGKSSALITMRGDAKSYSLLDLESKRLKKTELPVGGYTEVDGTLFGVTSSGTVVAADERTGTIEWSRKTGKEAASSPPIVEDGRIYFATTDARIVCLTIDGGRKLWSSAARRDPTVSLDPFGAALIAVRDGRVYAQSQRHTLFALRPPKERPAPARSASR